MCPRRPDVQASVVHLGDPHGNGNRSSRGGVQLAPHEGAFSGPPGAAIRTAKNR